MDSNPLKQYFRQPAIYIRLPSRGNFYEQNAIEITPNGEYPVLPMTTLDEITYRTPDALFNGSAVPTVIQSCLPNIKNAWGMPAIDIDTVLTAIRLATYGHEMDITTQCPECKSERDYTVDLRNVIDSISTPDYVSTLDIGDLKIEFRPMTYAQINKNSMDQFEDQKMLQMLDAQEGMSDQEKMQQVGNVLKKISTMTTNALAKNIAAVITPQVKVTEPEHIAEWLANCERNMFIRIRDHILKIKSEAELKPLHVKCADCGNEYEQVFTLDMSNFFEDAS